MYNVGVITNHTDKLIGRRISSIKNINAVTKNSKIGFNLKKCTALHTFMLCANENIEFNSPEENICLNSIFQNNTYGCKTEFFENTRPCLVHNLGDNSFISAAIPYKIIKTFSTIPRTVETTHGFEGVLPLNFSQNNLLSTTLVCGDITKPLFSLQKEIKYHNILSGPDILTDLVELNFTQNFDSEENLKKAKWSLKQNLQKLIFTEKTSNEVVYLSIIGFLILMIFLKYCFFGKLRKYLKLSQIDIV